MVIIIFNNPKTNPIKSHMLNANAHAPAAPKSGLKLTGKTRKFVPKYKPSPKTSFEQPVAEKYDQENAYTTEHQLELGTNNSHYYDE